jgi:hypothetical protein
VYNIEDLISFGRKRQWSGKKRKKREGKSQSIANKLEEGITM